MVIILFLLVFLSQMVFAGGDCNSLGSNLFECRSFVSEELVPRVIVQQKESEWCWAAASEAILRFHGLDVGQSELVTSVLGSEANRRVSGTTITKLLKQRFKSKDGKSIQLDIEVFDNLSGIQQISNRALLKELSAGRPFICGSIGHAMLVVGAHYRMAPGVLQIQDVQVMDPLIGNIRFLTDPEMRDVNVIYAATVYVREKDKSKAIGATLWGPNMKSEVGTETNSKWQYEYWRISDDASHVKSKVFNSNDACEEAKASDFRTDSNDYVVFDCKMTK